MKYDFLTFFLKFEKYFFLFIQQNITITAKNPLSDDLCEALIQAAASMPDASEQQIASIINNNVRNVKCRSWPMILMLFYFAETTNQETRKYDCHQRSVADRKFGQIDASHRTNSATRTRSFPVNSATT